MTDVMLFPCSYAEGDPERATLPFIAASTAAVSGHRAVVVCTVEGVRLGLPGVAEGIDVDGMTPLVELVRTLVEADGEIWLCSACTSRRGITGDDALVEGASIVGAATIVDALASGRAITLA